MAYQRQSFQDQTDSQQGTLLKAEHFEHMEDALEMLCAERKIVRVANINCGEFNYLPDGMTHEEALKNWHKHLGNSGFDLIGCEEFVSTYPVIGTDAVQVLFGDSVSTTISNNNGRQKLASKFSDTTKETALTISDVAPYNNVMRATVKFGDKTLNVYVAHLVPGETSTASRETQYRDIIADCQGKTNVIILADFNAWSVEEYAPFLEAGMKIANGSYYGDYVTLRDVPADNIIVSSDIMIKAVNVIEMADTNTDHSIIYADLLIG